MRKAHNLENRLRDIISDKKEPEFSFDKSRYSEQEIQDQDMRRKIAEDHFKDDEPGIFGKYLKKETREAMHEVAKVMFIYSPEFFPALFSMAFEKYDSAIRNFERTLERDASYPLANMWLGICHYKKGNIDESEKYLGREIEVNPKSETGYISLGIFHRIKGDKEKSNEYFNKAKRLKPDLKVDDVKEMVGFFTKK